MSFLQQLGVEAVVIGAASFKRDINQMQRSVDDAATTMTKSADSSMAMNAAMGAMGVAAGAVAIAIAGVTAAAGAMLALMNRGAEIDDINGSFGILEKSLGGTTSLLTELRKGAAGTTSDIELMRKTNMALIGTEGLLSQKFAAAIPKMLEVARVQANATGQSVEGVFNAMTMGVKIAQTRMLKHAGILIDATAANEKYAASIGKAAADLTFEETQMATLNAVIEAGGKVLQKYGGLTESADEKLNRIGATISNVLDRLALAVQPAFRKILDTIQPIYDFLSRFASAAAPYVGAIANMFASLVTGILGPVGKAAKALNAAEVAKAFFTGGAKMIGALAGGIAAGAKAVLDVVKVVAQGIANFLIGLSPPPEGPLHLIDVGGANVLEAWLEGFMGVSLDPVEQVANEVAGMMGGIGTAARDEVETRLAALDTALQPFQDRLSLVKAQFDALKEPVDAAFSSIDRQLETALTALNQGKTGSAAMVRQLDNQREALQKYVDAQQVQVDTAQIQLSMAQAQQAQERTALEIRKRMLGPAATADTPENLLKQGTASTNFGEYKPTEAAAAVANAVAPAMADVGNVLTGFDTDMANAQKEMGTAFASSFTAAGGDIAGLKKDVADIQGAFSGVAGKVGGIWDAIKPKLQELTDWFTKTALPNVLAFINTTVIPGIQGLIDKFVGLWNDVQPYLQYLSDWFTVEVMPVMATAIESFRVNIVKPLVDLLAGLWSAVQPALDSLFQWFTKEGLPKVTELVTALYENVFKKLVALLQTIWETVRPGLEALARFWALNGPAIGFFVGTVVGGAFSAVLSIVKEVVTWIGNAITKLNDFIRAASNFNPADPKNALGFVQSLSNVPILNDLLHLPHNLGMKAEGGPASGLNLVGEGGPELVTFSRQAYVISNQVSRLLASAASGMFASPAAYAVAGGGYGSNTTYNQQHSMGDVNFNGVRGADDIVHRMAVMRALGRVR